MDGIISAKSLPGALVGVLFAEDFDLPYDMASRPGAAAANIEPEPTAEETSEHVAGGIGPEPPQECEPEVIIPTYSAEELEDARRAGHEAGRHEGLQAARGERDETIRLLLASLVKQLEQTGAEASQVAQAASEAASLFILQCLASLLPHLCERHGPTEALAVAGCILPSLRREPRVGVRVHPAAVADMRSAVSRLDAEFAARIEVLAMDPLAAGDVRISWQDGDAVRDARAMLAQVHEILAMLGISTEATTLAKRIDDPAMQQAKPAEREMAYGG
jgi:flagellar biosynthesis/type III secretory pathway protein FliH